MPPVVATHDPQLSAAQHDSVGRIGRIDPSGTRSRRRTTPSPPPSPKSAPESNLLFEAAIIGNLRAFLDALSDPTVDVNTLDGHSTRRNVLFCTLVGTRSVRSVSIPSSPFLVPRVTPRVKFNSMSAKRVSTSPLALNIRARAPRSVSRFSRRSSRVQNYLSTSSTLPYPPQTA
jgi:hypothetical protein